MSSINLKSEAAERQVADERLAAAVTSYGVGSRSYNRTAEKREMDRQRNTTTAKYVPVPDSIPVPIMCHCRSFRYEHSPSAHRRRLKSDLDWRSWKELTVVGEYFEPWVG